MRHLIRLLTTVAALAASMSTSAARYWPPTPLAEWDMHLNNGVVYVTSPQFASHCANLRGQIDVSASVYNRSLFAYALSAKARGKALRYVIDDTAPVCVIDALLEF